MRVKGRVAVVTGAGGGMGRDMVIQLAERGADVSCCDVNHEALQETIRLAQASNAGVKVTGRLVDVTDRQALNEWAAQVVVDHGGVNLLFANAGIVMPGHFFHEDSATEDDIAEADRAWDKCFDVDYFGVLYSVRAFLPYIQRADEGYVVLTSSLNGFVTWPEHGAYTAAKFGVRGLAHALLAETSARMPHIHVAAVHPGGIATGLVKNSFGGADAGTMSEAESVKVKDADLMQDGFTAITMTTSPEAATIILNGVRDDSTRIVVGPDAMMLDIMTRIAPHKAYQFFAGLGREGVTRFSTKDMDATKEQLQKVTGLGWLRIMAGGGWWFALGTTGPNMWRAVAARPLLIAGAAGAAMLIHSKL